MSKKHVIIMINSLSFGGAERVASLLLNHYYHDSLYSVELVLLEDKIIYDIPKDLKVTVISSLKNEDSSIKKTLYIPFLAYKAYRYILKSNPDVIMSFLYRADFVNVLASIFHHKPIIVSERVNASSTYNNPSLNAKINKFLIRKLYPKADMVINVSEGTKEDLIENFGIEKKRQVVIYNPYNIEKIQTLSKESIDIKVKRDKSIVAVSRFRPIKNIEMLIRAFAVLSDDIELILVGDGAEEETLKELTKSLGVDDRVHFMGGQDNPYKYLSRGALYVSTSRSEGFPNALVEAMICGCCVISTDCPSGPREILAPKTAVGKQLKKGIEYAEYGTLIAMEDTNALTESLKYFFENPQARDVYSKKAYERAEDFQVKSIMKHYSEAFFNVIGEKGK